MSKSKKNRFKKKNKKNKVKLNSSNWLELPEDIWRIILLKLKTIELIEHVQKVCTLFRKICEQSEMFKIINMYLPDSYIELNFDVNIMTRFAVDRSDGGLIDIYLKYFCDDDTLMYIVQRSKNLKHLRLGHYIKISDEGLIEAVKRLPELEELETTVCSFSHRTFEAVGHACPSLKSFSVNDVGPKRYRNVTDADAFAIARSMPNLRRLQLVGNCLTNDGLIAIINGCPLLESLNLQGSVNINWLGDLGSLGWGMTKNTKRFCSSVDDDDVDVGPCKLGKHVGVRLVDTNCKSFSSQVEQRTRRFCWSRMIKSRIHNHRVEF